LSRRQIPFAAASSSLAELSTCIDVARPILRKNTGAHVAVNDEYGQSRIPGYM
jgi:hypothetical protein